MSTPTEPGDAERHDAGDQPTEPQAPESSPEAPTEAYPEQPAPAADAPTEAYPRSDAHPPVPPAPSQPAGQPAYGPPPTAAQPPYGAAAQYPAGYGQAPYTTAPAGPDTRPKTLAWFSVGLVALGVVLVVLGFLPLGWFGLISVIVGGLALIVGFILSIVVLASRKQGGKPLGIVALVVSVLGGGLWFVALVVSIAVGVTSSSTASSPEEVPAPAPTTSVSPGDDTGTETETESEAPLSGGEAAYLEEVRPKLVAIFQEIDPNITEESLSMMFPDATLVQAGEGFLLLGDSGREYLITSLVESGAFTEDAAGRFADTIIDAAEKHLQ